MQREKGKKKSNHGTEGETTIMSYRGEKGKENHWKEAKEKHLRRNGDTTKKANFPLSSCLNIGVLPV